MNNTLQQPLADSASGTLIDRFQSDFDHLIHLLNQSAFDLEETLEHIELMQCSYEHLGSQLDNKTISFSHFTPQGHHPLRLIPYLIASYEYHHAAHPPHRSLFNPPESECFGFHQAHLFELIDRFLSLGVALHDTNCIKLSRGLISSSIHLAAGSNDVPLLSFLISRGASVQDINEGYTPLRVATKFSALAATSFLLQNGADPDFCSPIFPYPISFGQATEGSFEMLQLLIRHGADLNHVSQTDDRIPILLGLARYGSKLLEDSLRFKQLEMFTWLIAHGAKMDVSDINGQTVLHEAATLGRVDIIALLIDHGAELNVPDKSGDSELHFAAMYGQVSSAAFLMSRGSNFRAKNREGKTAHDLAMHCGHHQAADCFKSAEERMILDHELSPLLATDVTQESSLSSVRRAL